MTHGQRTAHDWEWLLLCCIYWLQMKHRQRLQHFLWAGPVELVIINILGQLSEKSSDMQYVVAKTARYSKLSHNIPTTKLDHHISLLFPWQRSSPNDSLALSIQIAAWSLAANFWRHIAYCLWQSWRPLIEFQGQTFFSSNTLAR